VKRAIGRPILDVAGERREAIVGVGVDRKLGCVAQIVAEDRQVDRARGAVADEQAHRAVEAGPVVIGPGQQLVRAAQQIGALGQVGIDGRFPGAVAHRDREHVAERCDRFGGEEARIDDAALFIDHARIIAPTHPATLISTVGSHRSEPYADDRRHMGEGRPVEDDCYRAMDLDWSTS
jgi:hypothetical protein